VTASVSTGVASLDAFVRGGLELGDNVVWIGDGANGGAQVAEFAHAFLLPAAPLRRLIHLGGGAPLPPTPAGVERIELTLDGRAGEVDELERLLLADDVVAGSRLVIDGLDHLQLRLGAAETVRFYRRTCPRLFDRGAVAYWTGGRDALGNAVVDGISKIAQCVFDVHASRVRIVKMEGRSPRLQGATAVLEPVDGELTVGREHAGGRVAEGLRRLRRARNLSQTQIAALAGVTPGAISQAESGRRGLSLDTVLHLCDALGIGVDDLLASGVRADPQLARHDRGPLERRSVALFDDPSSGPLAHLVRLGPDESGTPPFRHKGTELVLVAEGLVLVDLGDTTPVLRSGDALMAGRVPVHRWTNLHDGTSTLFWIATEPRAGTPSILEPDDGVP